MEEKPVDTGTPTDTSTSTPTVLPTYFERRSTDLSNESNRTRLAVLEHKVDTFENRISDIEASLRFIGMKLDDKLRQDSETFIDIEGRLSTVGKAVELMADELNETAALAVKAGALVDKHETIGSTLLKIGSVATILIGALWGVFKYFVTF